MAVHLSLRTVQLMVLLHDSNQPIAINRHSALNTKFEAILYIYIAVYLFDCFAGNIHSTSSIC